MSVPRLKLREAVPASNGSRERYEIIAEVARKLGQERNTEKLSIISDYMIDESLDDSVSFDLGMLDR